MFFSLFSITFFSVHPISHIVLADIKCAQETPSHERLDFIFRSALMAEFIPCTTRVTLPCVTRRMHVNTGDVTSVKFHTIRRQEFTECCLGYEKNMGSADS